ncbi:hypothetical protein [Hathewaya limosa]|uniref:Uncharacterized protein n=1 Tax=Hathewaya limosa TaxID=1536 RepID=A0ABU0JRP4_HATLI|nr:hypothetical protein [Hathewaya limosa]MDQ0479765.1 hypothetical protein [Hathewaya limosa]
MIDKRDLKLFIIRFIESFAILYIFGVLIPNFLNFYWAKFARIKNLAGNTVLVYNNISIKEKFINNFYIIFHMFFINI